MNKIMIAVLAAVTLTGAAAQAQGLQPNGTRAGGYGQSGAPGQIGPEQRTYLRTYVTRQGYAPALIEAPMAIGTTVPGTIELRAFPDTVYGEVPAARSYQYIWTGQNVILVDPVTRQVVEVIS